MIPKIPCLLVLLGFWVTCVAAQSSVVSYIELGSSTTATPFKHGIATQVDLTLSPQIVLQAGLRLSSQYPSALGDLKAGVKIYPSKNNRYWSIENVVNYSLYAPYPMGQLYYCITGRWQTEHFSIDMGNAFAFLVGSGVVKYNLFRPSFALKGVIRDANKCWNAALFIRNFNRFEVHGSKAIEWGMQWTAHIKKRWTFFCEPYVTTVGNFNGTATFYNFNCLMGGAYRW